MSRYRRRPTKFGKTAEFLCAAELGDAEVLVGLDEVEQQLHAQFGMPAMAAGRDERMVVWLEGASEDVLASARGWLTAQYGLHHSLFRLRAVENLPMLGSGKRDYQALRADA